MRYQLLYIILIFINLNVGEVFSQTPSYFFIGTTEFSNLHVYSLKCHPDGRLFAATNTGLYSYKNGKFQQFNWLSEHKGDALFSLNFDGQGELYCSNLYGQIFHLTDSGLQLYLETPKEYLNTTFDFAIDSGNGIIIQSKVCAYYKSKWTVLYEQASAPMNTFNNDRILFTSEEEKKVYQIVGDQISFTSSSDFDHLGVPTPAYIKDELVVLSNEAKWTNITQQKEAVLCKGNWYTYQLDENEFWMRSTVAGARRVVIEDGKPVLSELMFDDLFISTVTKSEDGTYFLGTFGKGVIVVPSMQSIVYKTGAGELMGLCSASKSEDYSTYLASTNRSFLVSPINGKAPVLVSYDPIFYSRNVPFGLFETIPGLFYQNNNSLDEVGGINTIKDMVVVNDSSALVATSIGVFKVGKGLNHINWIQNGNGPDWWRLKPEYFRCKAVGYSANSEEIYYATPEQLFFVNNSGQIHEVKWKNKSIKCNSICSESNQVICATHGNGVLFLQNGKVQKVLSSTNGLGDNRVRHIISHNDELYLSHNSGFQIYNLKNKSWRTIGNEFGIQSGSVRNFIIQDETLWLLAGGELFALPLSDLSREHNYNLIIDDVLLGDKSFLGANEISSTYDQSDLSVLLNFRGILYEREAKIAYRLNENDWKLVDATSRQLDFEALAPGNYQLDLHVDYHGKISHEQQILFTIKSPFWQKWWFFSVVILFTLGIAYFVFKRRLSKIKEQQKRLLNEQRMHSEMLESELKALRSQMNPHFIFNSLNSIQNLILQEDTDSSYDYIVLFAKLVRNTLNYSNLDFISIDKELEFLNTYLLLEKLRFA
ncbi:MAG: histidine kinase, partial [Flavobacteriales bacterium]|nr:histidine kinase [Flavobacteriales bacterium]